MVLTEEEKKERHRISDKKYRESEIGKERKRISDKEFRESEKGKEYYKNYRKTEKGQKYSKSEKGKLKRKEYLQSEKGIKNTTKGSWKKRGLNMENFEEIYKRYKDAIFCDICECVLEGNGRNRKCMDHDHDTGEFRNIVCFYCNLSICK